MANRNFNRMQALNKEVKVIAGRLEDDDTAKAGLGWTGANTGTGVYVIMLEDKYRALLACTATLQTTTGTDDYNVCVAAHDVSSARTITLHVYKSDGDGTGTLTDLGDTDELHFAAFLQNSSLPSV